MTVFIYLVKWLQASVSCTLAGLLVWAALQIAQRCWPALMPRRAVWMASQAVIVGAALLVLLPQAPPVDARVIARQVHHPMTAAKKSSSEMPPAAPLTATSATSPTLATSASWAS